MIRDGLRSLHARDRVIEAWLKQGMIPAYGKLRADPSSALTIEPVRAEWRERHAAQVATAVSNNPD